MFKRRHFIASGASALLAGCDWASLSKQKQLSGKISGSIVGSNAAIGHALRDGGYPSTIEEEMRTSVAIVGSGIAGLAVARQLRQAGITDYKLFDLEDSAGGNSRSMNIEGIACPMGAHYLPTPDERNEDLNALLQELKLLRIENGQRVFDERQLSHSPQERLLTGQPDKAQWQEGLLPAVMSPSEQSIFARYADMVGAFVKGGSFTIPTASSKWNTKVQALDKITLAQWLKEQGLQSETLQWYLDYSCRDDYGANAQAVSAWAGLHYFASRHGFTAPGTKPAAEQGNESVFTWGDGNGHLSKLLAAPHAEKSHLSTLVTHVQPDGQRVRLQLWDTKDKCGEICYADHVVICTPMFIAKRLLREHASPALNSYAQALQYSSWSVANVYVPTPLGEWPGAPRAWDNVMRMPGQVSAFNLGYVDAMHQALRPTPASAGPTVLTNYYAYGTDPKQRKQLLQSNWNDLAEQTLKDLQLAHPDIRKHAKHIDIVRYGHAMAVPTPGMRSHPALTALQAPSVSRIHFAHSDLSAYSVFEEAFYWGTKVGRHVAGRIKKI